MTENNAHSARTLFAKTGLPAALLVLAGLLGCGGAATVVPPATAATPTPPSYFGPAVSPTLNRSTYVIDHTQNTFVQSQYLANQSNQQYVANSGTFTVLPNGILNIGISYGGGTGLQGNLYSPAQSGNYAVESPGQFGLVGLLNQPVTPVALNQQCPSYGSAQAFQFVTLPLAGDKTGTAYGTFSAATGGTSGTTVSLTSIAQFTVAGSAVVTPAPATIAGICAPTFYGQTVSVPTTSTVTNPGNGQTQTPTAILAISPGGFVVEDNGYTANPAAFQNVLGAGTGAVGVAVPAAAVSTSTLVGAQYTGFVYATGAAGNAVKNLQAVAPATRVVSFGYPSVATSCATLPAPQTGTVLYGGEFTANNPAGSSYGNCDFALDLGAQDSTRHGLYPAATITLAAAFPGNTTGRSYSFQGAAVAGQVNGKFAIFVIALDSVGLQVVSQGQQSQDWGVYLLQSN